MTSIKPKKGIEANDDDDEEIEETKQDRIEFLNKK